MVIWLTGISGSGKSTIAKGLMSNLKPIFPALVALDGDIVRELFGGTLGFDRSSRVNQIKRIQTLVQYLDSQGLDVIVSALYCDQDLMEWNRCNFQNYFEVYVNTPLEVVIKRDTKGLYKKALNGELRDVVGLDIPWIEPANPDLILETTKGDPSDLVKLIMEFNPLIQSRVNEMAK